MPETLRPGVFIQETSFRGKPIQGVSTSTAAFVGAARSGPEGNATFISSFPHFKRIFGKPEDADLGDGRLSRPRGEIVLRERRQPVLCGAGARAGRALLERSARSGHLLPHRPHRAGGPSAILPLNTLRGVTVGTQLNIANRGTSLEPFGPVRTVTVEATDPVRNTATLAAADALGVAPGVPAHAVIKDVSVAPADIAADHRR